MDKNKIKKTHDFGIFTVYVRENRSKNCGSKIAEF